jgi:hypothetical protein
LRGGLSNATLLDAPYGRSPAHVVRAFRLEEIPGVRPNIHRKTGTSNVQTPHGKFAMILMNARLGRRLHAGRRAGRRTGSAFRHRAMA